MSKKNKFMVPFSPTGILFKWTDGNYGIDWNGYRIKEVQWRENFEFEAELHLLGAARGRSAVTFGFTNSARDATYPMFLVDFVQLLINGEIDHGKTEKKKWTFSKRGENYGIKLVVEE